MTVEISVIFGAIILSLPFWFLVIKLTQDLNRTDSVTRARLDDEEAQDFTEFEPGLYHPREEWAKEYMEKKVDTLNAEQFNPYDYWDAGGFEYDESRH